ncbi:MAG: DUF1489 domain-containing protein [Azospirillaceae bacterium]
MTMHLLRMAVGIRDLAQLQERQRANRHRRDGRDVVHGYTRRRPTRAGELLDGGSIYWILRGAVRVRQRLLAFDEATDERGTAYCRLVYDPGLVLTEAQPRRPMQGWRYLAPSDAPADIGPLGADDLPPDLAASLREIGLL